MAEEHLGAAEQSLSEYQGAYFDSAQCSGPTSKAALLNQSFVAEALLKRNRAHEARLMMEGAMPAWHALGLVGPKLYRPVRLLAQADVAEGKFRQAELTLEELLAGSGAAPVEEGTELGLLHLVWAEALLGEHRTKEALVHAEQARRLFAPDEGSPEGKGNAEQADALLHVLSR